MKHDVSNNYIEFNGKILYIGDVIQAELKQNNFDEYIVILYRTMRTEKVKFKFGLKNKKTKYSEAFNFINEIKEKRSLNE